MSTDMSDKRQLLPSILDHRAQSSPGGIWAKYPASDTTYKSGFKTATNNQVANAVNIVAWKLKDLVGDTQGFPTIAYLGPNDLRYYVVMLAAIKVGCKAFLPSPRNSNVAHLALLSGLGCKFLVTPDPAPACVPPILEEYSMQRYFVPSLHELLSAANAPHYIFNKSYEEVKSEPILVLHTSGSTGIPKPLTYTNEFVTRFANVLALQPPDGHISLMEKAQRGSFLSFLPPFHVAGVGFSLWSPFFCNSIPIYPLPGKPPSTEDFLEAVEYADFDWAFLLPVMLDELSRNSSALKLVSSKLQHLFYTGGSLPTAAADILTQSIPVFPCLGSSEAAGLPLVYPQGGSGFDVCTYVQPHPAANIEFRHRYGDSYEMVIIRSRETEDYQPVFAQFPDLGEFETRDLFTRHTSRPDAYKHQGRVDDIIVFINGEKTNPVTFEQEVGRHPEVRSALVAGSQRFEACLLLELLDSSVKSAEEQKKIIERIWPVIKEANQQCPSHARVSKDRILFIDPARPMLRAGKGTVQRQGTLSLYENQIDELYAATGSSLSSLESPIEIDLSDLNAVTAAVYRCVVSVTDWSDLNNEVDFFSLGMDSLQVLQLSRELKNKLSLDEAGPIMIYKSPSVTLLASFIHHNAGKATSSEGIKEDQRRELDSIFSIYKLKIDQLVQSRDHTNGIPGNADSEVVILTGSTGAVGSYILDQLLKTSAVSHVYCLNRSKDSQSVQERRNIERGLAHSFPPDRVTFLTADLGHSNLGLDTVMYDTILSSATRIIHNAWPVNFNQSVQSFLPSLDQLWNLISLAASARFSPSLFFLSSISAVTNYHAVQNAQDQVPESAINDPSCPPGIGYGQSKFTGERILDYAAIKLGVKTGAARVGQVAGAARDPWGWNRHEWFPSLIITSRNLGALPLSLGAFEDEAHEGGLMDLIDWVPIDQLAPVLVELSSSLSSAVPTTGLSMFHPLSPHPREWKTLIPAVSRALTSRSVATGVDNHANEVQEPRVVEYTEWLELLRAKMEILDDPSKNQLLADFPAIKLFDFFEDTLVIKGKDQVPRRLSIAKALEASPSLRQLEAVQDEWMEGWVRAWLA